MIKYFNNTMLTHHCIAIHHIFNGMIERHNGVIIFLLKCWHQDLNPVRVYNLETGSVDL